jgi:hypothetical protein
MEAIGSSAKSLDFYGNKQSHNAEYHTSLGTAVRLSNPKQIYSNKRSGTANLRWK